MKRNVRNDHKETAMKLDPETVEIPTTPLCSPLNGWNKSYKTVGWWKAHMKKAHPQCVVVENLQRSFDMEVASTVTSEAQTSSDKNCG